MAKLKTTLVTWEDVDQALLKIGKALTYVQKEEAEMNRKLQEVRNKYESNTSEKIIEIASAEIDIESWCELNKNQFETVRSKELTHGTVGFRITPSKVSTLNRKYTWATVLELMKKFKWAAKFIRTKEEPDKELLLKSISAGEVDDVKLAAIGLKVNKQDKFGYDIKWDTLGEVK
jgi:phage host-nuclease inhibitor protein Gam